MLLGIYNCECPFFPFVLSVWEKRGCTSCIIDFLYKHFGPSRKWRPHPASLSLPGRHTKATARVFFMWTQSCQWCTAIGLSTLYLLLDYDPSPCYLLRPTAREWTQSCQWCTAIGFSTLDSPCGLRESNPQLQLQCLPPCRLQLQCLPPCPTSRPLTPPASSTLSFGHVTKWSQPGCPFVLSTIATTTSKAYTNQQTNQRVFAICLPCICHPALSSFASRKI